MPAWTSRLKLILKLTLLSVFIGLSLQIFATAWEVANTKLKENSMFVENENGKYRLSDFPQFYTAGVIAKEALFRSQPIYDSQRQIEIIKVVTGEPRLTGKLLVQYPPHFYLMMIPFTLVTAQKSWAIWTIISTIFILAGSILIARTANKGVIYAGSFAVCTISAFPAVNNLFQGQTAAFMLFGVALSFYLMKNKLPFASGLATAITILKVQFIPCLFIPGVVLYGWRYFGGCLTGAFILSILLSICFGWSNVIGYPEALLRGEKTLYVMPELMVNVRGQLLGLGVSESLTMAVSLACMLAAFLVVFLVWKSLYERLKQSEPMRFELCAAITVLLLVPTSVHAFAHDYVLLEIPCAWMFLWLLAKSSTKANKIARALIVTFGFWSWLSVAPYFRLVNGVRFLVILTLLTASLLLRQLIIRKDAIGDV